VIPEAKRASEAAEVSHCIVLPEHGVSNRCCAIIKRSAHNLAAIVDPFGFSRRVAGERQEFVGLALFPEDRLKLEYLGGHAGWVMSGIFRQASHLTPVVDAVSESVVAPQRWERRHHAVLPNKR
jgi:hypothetical protein